MFPADATLPPEPEIASRRGPTSPGGSGITQHFTQSSKAGAEAETEAWANAASRNQQHSNIQGCPTLMQATTEFNTLSLNSVELEFTLWSLRRSVFCWLHDVFHLMTWIQPCHSSLISPECPSDVCTTVVLLPARSCFPLWLPWVDPILPLTKWSRLSNLLSLSSRSPVHVPPPSSALPGHRKCPPCPKD